MALNKAIKSLVTKYQKKLKIKYKYVRPPGLTKQRNVGIDLVRKGKDNWLGFLDDDVVLEKECLKSLRQFIGENEDYVGVGLRINNQPLLRKNPLRRFFFI